MLEITQLYREGGGGGKGVLEVECVRGWWCRKSDGRVGSFDRVLIQLYRREKGKGVRDRVY